MNPTYREPAPQAASVPFTSGKSSAPVKGDALALVKALDGFGVPESVLEQVQGGLVPPKRDAGNAWEKALSDCKAQLHILRQRLAKQRMAVSNAQEALDRSQEKLTGLEDEVAKLDLRYREVSVEPLTPSSSKVGDGPRLEKVQEEVQSSDDMDLTNKFVGPDPPEPPTGSPPQDRIIFLPPFRLRRLCKTRMLLNGVVLRRRSRMIRCSMQLLMGRCLNMTVHSFLLGCDYVRLESEGSVFPDHWEQDERL